MPPAGFEFATPASDRPQTFALDRSATENVTMFINHMQQLQGHIIIYNKKRDLLIHATEGILKI